jgi:hypothetical protein
MSDPSPLILFPDTNVFIQGRALKDQPWGEFGRDAINVILCGPVIRELDRLKQKSGRVGRVARAISTKVRELMSAEGRAEVLREADPRVVLSLAPAGPNPAAVREGIDLSHDDQAIINQALTRLDSGADVALLTDDNFAAMTAEHFGLPVRLLAPHWLKEPETDDREKELAKKDVEIARLKAAEPRIQLRFADPSGASIDRLEATMDRFRSVPPQEVQRLVERVSTLAPMADIQPTKAATVAQPRSTGKGFDISSIAYPALGMLPVTQNDIDTYQEEHRGWLAKVRSMLAHIHDELNDQREWPQAIFYACNDGSRPAVDVLVELEASGRFAVSGVPRGDREKRTERSRDGFVLPLPPRPPRPKSHAEIFAGASIFDGDPFLPHIPYIPSASELRRNDDEFYWREGKSEAVKTMSLECKTWRHGREEEDFPLRIWASDDADIRGLIVGRVSAHNIGAPIEKHLPLRIGFEDRDCLAIATGLVDDFERRIARRPYALAQG